MSHKDFMGIKADDYNETNKLQYNDANDLVNKIVDQNKDKKFDIILDIGCGSGNATLLLHQNLAANRIVAIDIDEDMIDFAKTNHQRQSIDYMVQDISADWDQLRPELRQLEAKVSLVFSNQVLHWIEKKDNAANNVYRLLAADGEVFANIHYISNPFRNLTDEEKDKYEKLVMKVPTREEQLNVWIDAFNATGITIIESKSIGRKISKDLTETIRTTPALSMSLNLRRQYIVSTDENERNEIVEKYFPIVRQAFVDNFRKRVNQNQSPIIEFPSVLFYFKLRKNITN